MQPDRERDVIAVFLVSGRKRCWAPAACNPLPSLTLSVYLSIESCKLSYAVLEPPCVYRRQLQLVERFRRELF